MIVALVETNDLNVTCPSFVNKGHDIAARVSSSSPSEFVDGHSALHGCNQIQKLKHVSDLRKFKFIPKG